MWYLFGQIFVWIAIAFVAGWLMGYFFRPRNTQQAAPAAQKPAPVTQTAPKAVAAAAPKKTVTKKATAKPAAKKKAPAKPTKKAAPKKTAAKKPVTKKAATKTTSDEKGKPVGFSKAPSDKDDLKKINGIGKVLETKLNGFGIYKYEQVASFTNDNIKWIDSTLSFPGRIKREEWVKQAKKLAK